MSSSSSSDDQWSERNKNLSKDNLQKMQDPKFELFKSQDLESGCFNVTFEIGGKLIYADKFTLVAVSETLAAMLSDRWTTKDASVKLESCSYNDFYEFLCFVYSGCCKLTSENFFRLVDLAEFYGLPCLKEFCDKFLFDMKKTAESIEEIYDYAVKYSLSGCMDSIKKFVNYGRSGMYKTENFLAYKKPFVEFLSTLDRDGDYFDLEPLTRFDPISTDKNESGFFELVYQWAEHQVMKQKPVDDENFNLEEAIKIELQSILPNVVFSQMNLEFLKDFVVEKGFLLSRKEFHTFFNHFRYRKHAENAETLLRSVYGLAEKQAIQKQKIATKNGKSFNITDSVKADLAQIIPDVKFYQMDKQFLMDFVVAKGVITEEKANHVDDTRVQIKNSDKIITGVFKDIFGIHDAVVNEAFGHRSCIAERGSDMKRRFQKIKFPVPKTPSTVTKMKGVDWYLCLEDDGILTFKHYSLVGRSDYLLAEMKSKNEFKLNRGAMVFLSAGYRNLAIF